MLTIFNRAELLITYDLARFCQVRDALEAAGIDFTYKVRNRTSPTMTAAEAGSGLETQISGTTPIWSTACSSIGTSWTGRKLF